MHLLPRLSALCLALTLPLTALRAQDPAPAPAPEAAAAPAEGPTSDLDALVGAIKSKLQAGAESAEDLAAETAAFDTLLAKYAGNKSEEVAAIAFTKATYYFQILEDEDGALKVLQSIKTDFADSEAAANVDRFIQSIENARKAKLAQANLVGNPAPELHFNWATRKGLTKLSDLRGKVVVIDFWATWCGPCIATFPKIAELEAHYAGSDVVILGVTSIQGFVANLPGGRVDTKGDPDRERALLPDFIAAKNVTWDIAVSDEEVFNPDYGVTGIPHMVMIAPDGTVRQTGLHPGMPEEEKQAMIDAILTEFKLPVPATKS